MQVPFSLLRHTWPRMCAKHSPLDFHFFSSSVSSYHRAWSEQSKPSASKAARTRGAGTAGHRGGVASQTGVREPSSAAAKGTGASNRHPGGRGGRCSGVLPRCSNRSQIPARDSPGDGHASSADECARASGWSASGRGEWAGGAGTALTCWLPRPPFRERSLDSDSALDDSALDGGFGSGPIPSAGAPAAAGSIQSTRSTSSQYGSPRRYEPTR